MYINSMGNYVPSARITNEYFENLNGLEPGWILQRTGIISRSKAASDEGADSMALAAIDDALGNLPYAIKDVDLIVAACYAAYDTVATPAHVAQQHYDISGAKAVYVSAACSSFINGLEVIEGYFASGKAKRALLICTEHNTYYSNEKDHKAGHLWGRFDFPGIRRSGRRGLLWALCFAAPGTGELWNCGERRRRFFLPQGSGTGQRGVFA